MTTRNLRFIPSTITARLGSASILSATLVLFLAVVALTAVEYFNLRRALIEDSRVEAEILADNISSAVLFEDREAAAETLKTMRVSKILNQAAAVLLDGRMLAAAPDNGATPELRADAGYLFKWWEFQITQPIRHQDAVIGYIYLSKALTRMYRQIAVYFVSATGIGAAALLLMWILVSRAKRELADSEQKLHHMAHIDAVTQIWNRNAFNTFLKTSIEHADKHQQQVAVLLLDLDNFKTINDTFGHQGGDELLHLVAKRLQGVLGEQHLLSRLGGDEFAAILLGWADKQAVLDLAAGIAEIFARAFAVGTQELYITCSIGISVYPEDADDIHTLIRNADVAMYRAKLQGKNTYQLFLPEMNDRIKKRVLLEAGLRRALANNELTLHYQPQFDLKTQRLAGAEVLLRWNSRELGSVSPADFIPVAEESGLIIPIGDWVLNTACAQIAAWDRANFNVPTISINLSAQQLRVSYLAEHILNIVADNGISPEMLELELTESMLMENVQEHVEGFMLLRSQGMRLSIDDFGTGYSSMAYLKQLPLDKIKIDRVFINDLPHSENDRQIVAAIVAMAHNLGITVTAEGVERQEQAAFLQEIACDFVQGFYFGRPVTAHAFENLLQKFPDY
jgi:diguanylate cyclase (GGDEF)-like protein